jgi:hypothetical protein
MGVVQRLKTRSTTGVMGQDSAESAGTVADRVEAWALMKTLRIVAFL